MDDASSDDVVGGMMLSETKRVSGHTVDAMAPANVGEERRGEARLICVVDDSKDSALGGGGDCSK